MTLEQELLERAREAGSRLLEAERVLQLARAEYHTSVRRLHLAGGSLREVAEALGMSHQRVQQMVEGAGGSWWQRIRRGREPKRDAVCTFCERPPSEVAKLVAGPNVFICDRCIGRVEAAWTAGPGTTSSDLALAGPRARAHCSFCGKSRSAERPIVVAKAASVCGECLAMCRRIVDGRKA
jgi:hypothetical protein